MVFYITNMASSIRLLDRLFTSHRWMAHLLFWVLTLFVYTLFFGRQNNNYLQTSFFVGLLMPVTIGTTYFLNYFLLPRYLMNEKYGRFVLYFVYTLVISVFLESVVVILTFLLIARWQIRNMSPASIDFFFLFTALIMVVFLGVAIKLLLHWRESKEHNQQLMREKVESELRFLKAQLKPHFLFNTLNNLYYLTVEKSPKAPEAVLQLSEMLDYVMHAASRDFVPIENEWKQVQNYIALESMRYENRLTITTNLSGAVAGRRIAPMILITLVENAFKHGVMKVTGKSWIDVSVMVAPRRLDIHVRNSRRESLNGNGIGLVNLRSQLDLTYGRDYQLLFDSHQPEEFAVELTISESA